MPVEESQFSAPAGPPATVPEEPGGDAPGHLLLACNDMKMRGGLLR